MFRVIVLTAFFSCYLPAQVLTDIYKKFIPSNFLSDQDNIENLNSAMGSYAEISPELLYYYIEYVKRIPGNIDEARKANQYLMYLKNEFLVKQNIWISGETDIAGEKTVCFPQWLRLRTYFYMLQQSPDNEINACTPPYTEDKHFRDYITYLYYLGEYRDYDSSADYKGAVNKILSVQIDQFNEVYKNPDNYSAGQREEFYQLAADNFILFKGSTLGILDRTAEMHLAEFLVKMTSSQYYQNNSVALNLEYDRFNDQDEKAFVYSDDRFIIHTAVHNPRRLFYFGGLGGSIRLSEYKTMFSTLKFSFSASYSESNNNPDSIRVDGDGYYVLYGDYQGSTVGVRVDPEFHVSDVAFSSLSMLMKLTTPVLYLRSNLHIEGGAMMRYTKYNYKAVFSRQDYYKHRNLPGLSEELLVQYEDPVEYPEKKLRFYPIVALNYNLINLIDLKLSMYDMDLPQFSILLNFNF